LPASPGIWKTEPGRVPALHSLLLEEFGERPAWDMIELLRRADSRLLSAVLGKRGILKLCRQADLRAGESITA